MSKVIQPPQPIIDYGWQFYEKCNCNYMLKYKYRHADYPGLVIEWWVKYYKFKVINSNLTKVPPTPITQLSVVLEKIKRENDELNSKLSDAVNTVKKITRAKKTKENIQQEAEN